MWLLLLLPTKQLHRLPAPQLQSRLLQWCEVWDQRVGSTYWDGCWLALMARCAKDDNAGAVMA